MDTKTMMRVHRLPCFDTGHLPKLGLTFAGAALIATAWIIDSAWFDRHFLPDFFFPRYMALAFLTAFRLVAVLLGLGIILVWRPRAGRYARSRRRREILGRAVLIVGAMASAVITTELILRTRTWHPAQFFGHEEPLRIIDSRLGWVFVPGHHGHQSVDGRRVDYVVDSNGYRVSGTSRAIDFKLPTVVLSGESSIVGQGLQWGDSIAGQLEAHLGVQIANVAVHGYSTDQSLMRLGAELPRFSCPVAVVSIFMTGLLDRNLDDDRPFLDRNLHWHPARQIWRLHRLARQAIPYRNETTIEAGIAMTRSVLRAAGANARSRGAVPILLVPAFTPETPVERALRKRVLDDAGLDYLFVPINSRWRIASDMHPDARAAGTIAATISKRLESYHLADDRNSGKQSHHECGKSLP